MITDSQQQMVANVLGGDMRGRLLRKGGRGVSVRALQLFLKSQGIDVGKADGKFGDRTLAGLKEYQKQAGITVDGKAGNETFGAIRKGIQGSMAIPREKPADMGMSAPVTPVESAALPPLGASAASPLPHPISKPSPDFSMADEPPVWQGGNSPLAGQDAAPMPASPPDLKPPSFGGTETADSPVPDFNSPVYGSGLLYPEISMPANTGSPSQNAQNAFGLDQLAQALKARVDQQNQQGAAQPMPQQGMDQGAMMPVNPQASPAYADIIRALMAGSR